VRPDASWCTLCYQDLRPEPALVTSPGMSAPLVDASLEPGPVHAIDSLGGDGEILDAEVIGEDGVIIAPRSGAHDSDDLAGAAPGQRVDLDKNHDPATDGESSGLAALTWSCTCGEMNSFAHDECPVCGAPFLAELRDGAGGRHRPGSPGLSWLPESRQVRLAASAFIAIGLAVFIPLLISFFG
jgi:hypothetical protein